MRLVIRRGAYLMGLLTSSVAALWTYSRYRETHPHLVYFTGWVLLSLMLYLTAYNARKKLPFLPLFSSRTWLQVHLYLGLFTGLVFLLHLRWGAPHGWFEITLTLLFLGVTLSGLFGWWLSRTLPKRLTTAGGEVPFERIPIIRREIQEQAEKLVLTGIVPSKADTLADLYAARLAVFFGASANFGSHLVGSSRPLDYLLNEIAEVDRFLNAAEKKTVVELSALVRQKDMLDFHWAAQLVMKGWLFVHIPLTYGLLVFSVVHVVLVYAFSGGAR